MSKFKVGDKVVCKRSTGEVHDYLIPDAVYTVTGTISDLIHIEGQPSEHCLERIKQGFASYEGWKQCWEVGWFQLYSVIDMKETAEQIREDIILIDTLIEKSKKDIEEAEKKRESLVEQLREKGFLLYEKDSAGQCVTPLSVDDVHAGDRLILTKDSHNFRIQQGCIVSVEVNDKSGIPFGVRCLSTGMRDWVKLEDVKRA